MSAEAFTAEERLAVYGTLAPGRSNAGVLARLGGAWTEGVVRGRLVAKGWGAAQGYPGLHLDPDGPEVAVWLLSSRALPAFWSELDAFEGEEYRRVTADISAEGQTVAAQIYVVRTD